MAVTRTKTRIASGFCGIAKMVEAVGVEPTSEKTSNRELSCFSQVHLCLVSAT